MTDLPHKSTGGHPDKPSQNERGSFQRIGTKPNDTSNYNRGSTHGHHVSDSRTFSSSSSPYHRNAVQPRSYVDRDDPRRGTSFQDDSRHPGHHRRRSRSPPPREKVASDRARTVPWKDLRAPRVDHSDRASGEASSSKVSTSKPATTAINKRFANDISRWNRKQSELHASSAGDIPTPSTDPESTIETTTQADSGSPKPAQAASLDWTKWSEAELASYDYKDLERIACLLCQRKFKSIDTLHRHQAESQLHKDNLASITTCREAVARKLESTPQVSDRHAAISVPNPSAAQQDQPGPSTPAYRDRASERRAVFGADTPSKHNDTDNRNKVFDGPAATVPVPIPQSAPEKPIDSDNIGSKLLAMMGWSQGQGLGAQREGRTDIVEAKVYRPGAGLGSSGAQQASRAQEVAFTGYAGRVKDRARQRLAEQSQQTQ